MAHFCVVGVLIPRPERDFEPRSIRKAFTAAHRRTCRDAQVTLYIYARTRTGAQRLRAALLSPAFSSHAAAAALCAPAVRVLRLGTSGVSLAMTASSIHELTEAFPDLGGGLPVSPWDPEDSASERASTCEDKTTARTRAAKQNVMRGRDARDEIG